ncbi:NUDIX hydrolase [Kordiimonas gwangyangensis]|uniref:NUDIX hydrolase n=1 Tax=Kordiimonas gwangyangensis TaxID=288022 RepID=UPI00037F5ADD|nr:NUDIX hydrolase [Kordiimonas gwangyangensis]
MDARENPTRPIVGAGAVVMKDGQVLLIRRGKAPKLGSWSLPGGAQELGETIEETVIREVFEETGLEVRILAFLDVVDLIERDGDQLRYHYTLVDYLAEPVGGTLRPGTDAADTRFFSLEETRALPLWSETHRIIELAARQMSEIKERTDV